MKKNIYIFFLIAAVCIFNSTLNAQTISTVAGDGVSGYSGDGAAATLATLFTPYGVAIDRTGNVYISDQLNNVIRKVNSSGVINTVAGSVAHGYSGNGGAATNAELYYPCGVAVDTFGNLYIADNFNNVIRKVNSSGVISTFAGNGYGAGLGTGGYSGDGGAATNAKLYGPSGVVVDGSGNVYIADSYNNVIRKVNSSGMISTFAGNGYGAGLGTGGYSGDGSVATVAELNYPVGVTIGGGGNIYIADGNNQVIRIVNNSGIIKTFAGNGYGAGVYGSYGGYAGDGGSATDAELGQPSGVALDGSGNVYIADYGNNVIRKVNSSGVISTFAGNGYGAGLGYGGYSGDGGNTTAAKLYGPTNIACDASGSIYIADYGNKRIREVLNCPPITLSGGTSALCPANTASLTPSLSGGSWSSVATGVATVDGSGNVTAVSSGTDTISYTLTGSCGNRYATQVITVNPAPDAGSVSGISLICMPTTDTLTDGATGGIWSSSNNSIATVNSLGVVTGVAVGNATIIYTTTNSCGNAYATLPVTVNTIPNAGIISGTKLICMSGTGTTSLSDSIPGGNWTSHDITIATVNSSGVVSGVALGNTIISYTNSTVCGSITTQAAITVNTIPATPGSISGTLLICAATRSTLSDASSGGTWHSSNSSVASINSAGVMTGVNGGNATISYSIGNACGTVRATAIATINTMLTIGGVMTTAAGNGTYGATGDHGAAVSAELGQPINVALDAAGNLYIADFYGSRIRKVNTSGVITTVAGTGTPGYSGDGGHATAAKIYYPSAVCVDGLGNVYIADRSNNRIRKITTAGVISTIAGNGTAGFSGDGGAATAAALNYPTGIAVDASRNVYFTDENNQRIRKVNTSGIINTIAGSGSLTGGYSGDDSAATAATLNYPYGLAIDGAGNLFFTDERNGRVREISTTGIITSIASGYSDPWGITVDGSGNIYVSDNHSIGSGVINNFVVRINKAGTTDTIAGIAGIGSYSGDGSVASAATLYGPNGMAINAAGDLYIADEYNNRVRKISNQFRIAGGTSPVCPGGSISLGITKTGGVWTTSNTSVATVNPTGVVATLSAGNATITNTITNVCNSINTTRIITVNALPGVPATISGTTVFCSGAASTLTNTVGGGTWSSNNTSVATVNSSTGIVTGVAAGNTTIDYTIGNSCGSNTTNVILTVNPLPAMPAAITGTSAICATLTETLSDGTAGGSWISGNPTIATVNSTGIVTAIATGNATIDYTVSNSCGSRSATAIVTVNSVPNAGTLTTPAAPCAGSATAMISTVSGGSWSSGNTAVATVSGGIINAVSAGVATISYTVTNSCGSAFTSRTITVNPLPTVPGSISGTLSLCQVATTTLTNTVSGGTWSSSNTAVAAINNVTGIMNTGAIGNSTISYTFSNSCGSNSATAIVTVHATGTYRIANGEMNGQANNDEALNTYSLYPNPTTGAINIVQSVPEDNRKEVRIINFLGQVVYAGSVDFRGGRGQVELADMVAGLYIIELRVKDGETQIFRVVIER